MIHLAELNVAYAVVNEQEADGLGLVVVRHGLIARHEQTRVVPSFYECVKRIAVRVDGSRLHFAKRICDHSWLLSAFRTSARSLLPGLLSIVHP